MPSRAPTTWTLNGFLEHFKFVHHGMGDHAYAWVLGAGASKPSGIPLAGELVQRWLTELHRRLDTNGRSLQEWATAENLEIPKFDYQNRASFYSRVYERRFVDNPDEGFAQLEEVMSNIDPSPGYSILAQLLEKTRHKVVISTNFDNLVADALSIYTSTFPLIIGHESLANFVKVVSRRPVICKIHRDLLLGPKNDTRSLRRLHESWAAALRALFSQYTPLFIGYGGNDDSLMDLLESLDPQDIKGQLIWCYYERSEPSERIKELVLQFRGALVPVPDFDLLMVLLGAGMGLNPVDDKIEERARERAKIYRDRLMSLDTAAHPDVRWVLQGAFERAGGSLAWRNKLRQEVSTDRREKLYDQALEHYEDDPELQLEFAEFLYMHERQLDRSRALLTALQVHDRTLDYRPSLLLARLELYTGRLEQAERVLGPVPDTAAKRVQMGHLREVQGDLAAAEQMYRGATNGHESQATDLALFYWRHGRTDDAERLLRLIQAERRSHPWVMTTLACFLWSVRADSGSASRLFLDALGLLAVSNAELVLIAGFSLATGNEAQFAAALKQIESRPMDSDLTEQRAMFLRLVDEVLHGRDGKSHIEWFHRELEHGHRKWLAIPMEPKILATLGTKIPNMHRKFLPALAAAIYDPEKKAALTGFPQWRAAGASSAGD
jgi:hypothetical protein